MKRLLVIALVCLGASVASAQPVTIGWRPPAGCNPSDVIKWNGTAWVCGTVVAFTTSNVIPKGNGTGLGPSLLTDDATTLDYNSGKFFVDSATGNTEMLGDVYAHGGVYSDDGLGIGDDKAVDHSVIWGNIEIQEQFISTTPGGTGYGLWVNSQGEYAGDWHAADISNSGLFDTTAAARTSEGVRAISWPSKTGGNTLTSVAVRAYANGGDVDLSFWGERGTLKQDGNTILGDNASDAVTLLGTLNANSTAGSNGEILTVVSGVPKWAAPASTISGLTTNTITKATSSTAIGNSLLTDNATTLAYNTNKFTVAASTGNTTAAGLLRGTGGIGADSDSFILSNATTSGDALLVSQGWNFITPATGNRLAVDVGNTAGYDTTGGAITASGVVAVVAATREAGAAPLTNVAADFSADSGDVNLALRTGQGDILLNDTGGTTTIKGLLTATAGGTTPANWTTTGTGDLVSADDLTVADDATVTDVLSAGSDGFEVAAGRSYFGDTSNTSIASNVDVLTIGNTGTGQTASTDLIDASNSATVDTTGGAVTIAGTRQVITAAHSAGGSAALTNIAGYFESTGDSDDSYGIYAKAKTPGGGTCTQCETTGINHSYSVYAENTGGGGLNWSGYFTGGGFHVDGTGADFASGIAAQAGITVTGSALDVQTSISNSAGALSLPDDVTLGVDGSSALTATNGIVRGVNPYEGKHLEWVDDWLYPQPTSGQSYGPYLAFASGGALSSNQNGSGRPGVILQTTSTSSTGAAQFVTNTNTFNLGGSTESVFDWVGIIPTLSTSSEEFAFLVGFVDTDLSVNQTDGVYFLYDRGNVATSGPNSGNADKWSAWTASNSNRTPVILDGTTQGGITTVDSAVAAGSWPSTNVFHLKVVVTSNTSAAFYVNGTLRATITTNIPSGASRLVGAGMIIRKSAGLTARSAGTDYTRLATDLSSVRTP